MGLMGAPGIVSFTNLTAIVDYWKALWPIQLIELEGQCVLGVPS